MEECVRRAIRAERGITNELNREVDRIEERINRAERYIQEELGEESGWNTRERTRMDKDKQVNKDGIGERQRTIMDDGGMVRTLRRPRRPSRRL